MALPQPSFEQLAAQRSSRSPSWFGQLMMFSGTLFVIALAVYVGMLFGYKPYLSSRVDKLNDRIAQFAQEVPVEEQERIGTFYSQLANLKKVLDKHTAGTSILGFFERTTVSDVTLTRMSANLQNNQIAISASGRSVAAIAQQLSAWQQQSGVERVDFRSITQGPNNTYLFDTTLYVAQGLFTSTAQAL